jgi:regulatory protein YycH of two-component signal transduction system YycFG
LSSWWGSSAQNAHEGGRIEEHYLNLAAYSNNLIRTGTLGHKDKKESVTGIYYAIYKNRDNDEHEDESLENIAKRRAIIKDSWDFYRMVCSLLRDRRKYNETFRRMQQDPVYAYVNSLSGLNDPGDDGFDSDEKRLVQRDMREYEKKSKTDVCRALIKAAESTLPSLIEICKALAGSLGIEEVGVGMCLIHALSSSSPNIIST